MANFEEENAQLRAELAAMKEDLAKAHDAMSTDDMLSLRNF